MHEKILSGFVNYHTGLDVIPNPRGWPVCKGGSAPAPPPPPPAYEPPPAPEPPPIYEPMPSAADEAAAADLEAKKKKIQERSKGRGSTILTGLLVSKPEVQKPGLKTQLGG